MSNGTDFPVILSWCPNQSPPDKCDICAPTGVAWLAPYTPNLVSFYNCPQNYFYAQHNALVQQIAGNAGSYLETAYDATGKPFAQRSATFSYVNISQPADYEQEWQLQVKYTFSPSPTPGFPFGVTFSVSGSYQWVALAPYPNPQGLYVINTDQINTFL